MTTRAAFNSAFRFILAAIFYASVNQGPTPIYINWGEHRPMYAIAEYKQYFQNQKEYQEKEYLLQHFDLGVHLHEAAKEYIQTTYRGPLTQGTMTGTLTGDMCKIAKEVMNLNDYYTKAVTRLWLIFVENKALLYKITKVSVARINHLRDEEVGHLFEVVNEQNLDYCPYCPTEDAWPVSEESSDSSDDLFMFPMTPEQSPVQIPPSSPSVSEATTYLPSITEVLAHPEGYMVAEDHEPFRFVPNITVIDMEETLQEFDPYYDSD